MIWSGVQAGGVKLKKAVFSNRDQARGRSLGRDGSAERPDGARLQRLRGPLGVFVPKMVRAHGEQCSLFVPGVQGCKALLSKKERMRKAASRWSQELGR